MSISCHQQIKPPATAAHRGAVGLLQRKCACGGTPGPTGECEECRKKKRFGLQTKLKVNEAGDIYEQEADRIADRVMNTPARHPISSAPLHIQRFSGQPGAHFDAMPPSVNHTLANPGSPLKPALRKDMEQRFGHDFSRVRVHSGAAAEQSAREVNANAYTVGQNIVFGAGQFLPDTSTGRRLLSHELAHVVQQSGGGAPPGPVQEHDAEAVSNAVEMNARPRVRTSSRVGFAAQPRSRMPGGELVGPMEMDPENIGLKVVTFSEVEAKVARVLKAPGFSVAQGRKDFNANPAVAKANLYHSHFRDEHERLSYALGVFRQFLSIDGTPGDPDQLFVLLVSYQTQMESADIVIHTPPTKAENQRLIQLRAQARARELAAEEAKTLEAVRLIVEDYYTRGERLKPSVGATLLTIEEAAEAEKKGRTSTPYTPAVVPRFGFSYTTATFKYGLKKNRFTVVDPGSSWGGIIKIFGRYYYSVDSDTMFDRIFGVGAYAEQVWENTKHINVVYGHLVKGIGHIASLGNNPLGQMMGPMMETAGEGMLHDVRKIEARLAGEEFTEEAPEIGWRTMVQGLANVAGGKAGGFAGKVVGKFAPRAAPVVGVAVGMETSIVVTKSYEAAVGNIEWSDVFRPDVSPVEMLVGLVEGAVLHKFSAQWTKGRAPKVPKPEETPPIPKGKTTTPEPTGKVVTKATPAGDEPPSAGRLAGAKRPLPSFKPVPKGIVPELDKVRARWSEHDLTVTEKGLELCSPKPCSLVRKVYKRELKQHEQLATLLDDLELQRLARPKDAALREKSRVLEERLGELKARNDLVEAIPDKDLAARASGIVEYGLGLDRQQLEVFAKQMQKQRTRPGRQRLLNTMQEVALKSKNKRGADRMGAVDPTAERDIEDAIKEDAPISKKAGKTGGSTAPRQHPTAQDIGLNIDEIHPVGDPDPQVSVTERQRRALDLNNREFKDPLTNQRTKHVKIDERDLARLRKGKKPVSLEMQETVKGKTKVKTRNEYLALFTRRFSEIVEVRKIGERIIEEMEGKTTRRPGDLKEELNSRMWEEFKNPRSPEGRVVAEAIQRAGFDIVQAPNGQNVLRALTQGEWKARGFHYVEGQGWIRSGSSQ